MEMGLPSLPASFWADLKVCVPGLENLPYPKSRLKPTAAFQALPGNPAIDTHTHTHTHTCTHFDIKESLELLSCVHQHRPNMKTTFLDQPLNFITLSHQLVFSRQQLLFTLLTNFISFISKTQLAADEKLCPAYRPTATSTLFFHRVLCLWALLVFKTSKVEWSEEGAGW